VLDGVAEAVKGTHPGISAPGEDQLSGAASADELIVDDVRGHANQSEVFAVLTDDFVSGGEGNEVSKAFHGDGVAVMEMSADGGLE